MAEKGHFQAKRCPICSGTEAFLQGQYRPKRPRKNNAQEITDLPIAIFRKTPKKKCLFLKQIRRFSSLKP